MLGITINEKIGVGDGLQFSSLPENYFRATGRKLIDVSKPWFFDHNPYVMRDADLSGVKIQEMWNFGHNKRFKWPMPRGEHRPLVYTCNAEIWASVFGVDVTLNRPRLYRFETYPYEKRKLILLQVEGKSHGRMPHHVIEHVLEKYDGTHLYQIGLKDERLGIPYLKTDTLWDLAQVIAESRMLICLDSGPSWIGAAYPDVVVKKLRTRPTLDVLKDWAPLDIHNIHSHWDDRCHQIFNPSEHDVGFTSAYTKI